MYYVAYVCSLFQHNKLWKRIIVTLAVNLSEYYLFTVCLGSIL